MKTSSFLVLSFAAASLLPAQDKKPADPKVPTHSPEQSALNTVKEDARIKDKLKKAAASVKKATQENDAAKKEVERAEKSKLVPTTEEAKAKWEKLKHSVDPKDIQEYKKLLEEEWKKAKATRERNKKEDAEPPPPGAAPEPDPVPGSFDNSSKQEPLPVRKSPVFPPAVLKAKEMATGMVRDPNNPKVELPNSDPRTRTYVLKEDVRLRRPDIMLDADYTSLTFKEGQAPGGKKSTAADPIRGEKNRPIETLVARGKVRFMLVNKDGRVQAGRCGTLLYEDKSGLFILKDWPEVEIEGRLIRGSKKESVIRVDRLTGQAESSECDYFTLEKDLTPADVPRDAEHPVPPARPIRSGSSPSSSPIR